MRGKVSTQVSENISAMREFYTREELKRSAILKLWAALWDGQLF
jgi:hypothetical protein